MPIYEYICDECKAQYEKLVLSKNEAVNCPQCGSARKTLRLSTFAAHSGSGAAQAASRENSAPACMGNPSACGCSFKN